MAKYSPELAETILTRMTEGEMLINLAKDLGLSRGTVYLWTKKNPAFAKAFKEAREMQAHYLCEEMLVIADDSTGDWVEEETKSGGTYNRFSHEHVQRSKLRIDTRKTMMSCFNRQYYGDKTEVTGKNGGAIEHRHTVDAKQMQRIAEAYLSSTNAKTQ